METLRHLSATFLERHPSLAAPILESESPEMVAALLQDLEAPVIARVLATVVPITGAAFLSRIPREQATAVLPSLDAERVVLLVRHLEAEARTGVLAGLPDRLADSVTRALQSTPGTAGAAMNPLTLVLTDDLSVTEALRRVRSADPNISFYPFVVDRRQRLVGRLTARELMQATGRHRIADLMRRQVFSISLEARGGEISRIPGWETLASLPVVDRHGVFVGVLSEQAISRLVLGDSEERRLAGNVPGLVSLAEVYVKVSGAMIPVMLGSGRTVEPPANPEKRGEPRGE